MSLNSALNAAVSGLRGQSAAIAAVSENIANASTTAYKIRGISFKSLVNGNGLNSAAGQVGGGVLFDTRQEVDQQGLIQNTGVTTNIAINGSGFFVVSDDADNQPSAYQYSRNGDFRTDENGLVINNEGMILLGQRTDENGAVTAPNNNDLNSLVPVDLNTISGTAQSTTNVGLDMNLPADSATYVGVGDPEYTTALEVFDEIGVSHTIVQTIRKTGANTWDLIFDPPYQTSLGAGSAATTPVGDFDVDPVTALAQLTMPITFNGDGSINTINGAAAAPVAISMVNLTTGANDLTFNLDLGSQGLFDGLTQFSSNTDTPDIEISSIEQDGVRFGQLSGVDIGPDGIVTATFDNGVRRPIYQIPIATYPNPAGLTNIKGTVYDENERAGNYNLRLPGQGSAGTIEAASLELSSTDTSNEFNKMIVAQQAYSSAAQIVSTADEMFSTLLQAVN
jgi:flagellar hook protein FlgE